MLLKFDCLMCSLTKHATLFQPRWIVYCTWCVVLIDGLLNLTPHPATNFLCQHLTCKKELSKLLHSHTIIWSYYHLTINIWSYYHGIIWWSWYSIILSITYHLNSCANTWLARTGFLNCFILIPLSSDRIIILLLSSDHIIMV